MGGLPINQSVGHIFDPNLPRLKVPGRNSPSYAQYQVFDNNQIPPDPIAPFKNAHSMPQRVFQSSEDYLAASKVIEPSPVKPSPEIAHPTPIKSQTVVPGAGAANTEMKAAEITQKQAGGPAGSSSERLEIWA